MSKYYSMYAREQEWQDAEDEQLRQLGLDEESQNRDNPEWWIENGMWSED